MRPARGTGPPPCLLSARNVAARAIRRRVIARCAIACLVPLTTLIAACGEPNELYPPAASSVLVGTVRAAEGIAELPQDEITKDQATCGWGFRPSEQLVIGQGRGIRNVVVSIESMPAPAGWDALVREQPELSHEICRFSPHVMLVTVGDTLTLHNADPVLHNPHGYIDARTVFNRALPTGGMWQPVILRQPGILRVRCDAGHGWESAWLIVREHPYFAVTDADGRFRITDIPPGSRQVLAWHEHLGGLSVSVEIREDSVTRVEFVYPASPAQLPPAAPALSGSPPQTGQRPRRALR